MTSLPPSDDARPPRESRPSTPDPSNDGRALAPLIARALGVGPDVAPGACCVCGAGASLVRLTVADTVYLVCLACLEAAEPERLRLAVRFYRSLAMPVRVSPAEALAELDPAALCPVCGVTFADVSRAGLIGCPACYDAFGAAVSQGLQRLHPAT